MERIYTAEATAEGARTGSVRSSDGRLELSLSRPAALGGDDGPGSNPEQLFAAGYAACFHSAMRFGIAAAGLPASALRGSRVTARVHFLKAGEGDYGLAVDLDAQLPGIEDPAVARRVLEETHQVCPYSRATRGNVEVSLNVVP